MRRCIVGILAMVFLISFARAAQTPAQIRILNLQGEITMATAAYVAGQIERAENEGDVGIALLIDTTMGMAQAADEIMQTLNQSTLPSVAYVTGEARGAGVFVALSADRLYMAPFSTMGDVRTLPDTERVRTSLSQLIASLAASKGISQEWVLSMVEERQVYTAYEVVANQAALSIADNLDRVLFLSGYDGAAQVNVEPDLFTRIAVWLARPYVVTALFVLGICLLLIEAFGKGVGLPALLGLCCMTLFFGGGLVAGYAKWWAVALFAGGVVLALLELTTPGFWGFGALALIALVLSLYFGSRTFEQFMITLALSLLGVALTLPIALKRFFRLRKTAVFEE